MDFGIAVIGIVCVALCAMPFVITNRIRKKRENQLLQALRQLAKQENSEITQHEICGNYAIGIDENRNLLFFQLNATNEPRQQIVNLSNVVACNLVRRNLQNQTIRQLSLALTPRDKQQTDIVLDFYSVEWSFQLNGELQSIEKWNDLIKNRLAKIN